MISIAFVVKLQVLNKQLLLNCVKRTIFIHSALFLFPTHANISLFDMTVIHTRRKTKKTEIFCVSSQSTNNDNFLTQVTFKFVQRCAGSHGLLPVSTGSSQFHRFIEVRPCLSCLITYLKTARCNGVELTLHVISDGLVDVEIKAAWGPHHLLQSSLFSRLRFGSV